MAKSPAPQDPVDGTDEPAGLAPELEDFVAAEKVQGRTIAIMVLIAIVLVGAAGGAWFVFGEKLLRDPVQDIPVVRADPRPYKVLPEHPGGMQIPDRDKLVYERLQTAEDGAESAAPKVEQLLPPAEKPKALPEAPPQPEQAAEPPATEPPTTEPPTIQPPATESAVA
ncbi:MAG: hypothetical protein KDE22_13335, partial [Rhodobacterales bacterium]|nr:hypothetical protein [Rhodobacterales bacterium]